MLTLAGPDTTIGRDAPCLCPMFPFFLVSWLQAQRQISFSTVHSPAKKEEKILVFIFLSLAWYISSFSTQSAPSRPSLFPSTHSALSSPAALSSLPACLPPLPLIYSLYHLILTDSYSQGAMVESCKEYNLFITKSWHRGNSTHLYSTSGYVWIFYRQKDSAIDEYKKPIALLWNYFFI